MADSAVLARPRETLDNLRPTPLARVARVTAARAVETVTVVEAAELVRTLRIDELGSGVVPDATVGARPVLETLELVEGKEAPP